MPKPGARAEMEKEIGVSRLGALIEKWKWLFVAIFLFFLYSTGNQFIWGGDRLTRAEGRTASLEARVDSLEKILLPAIDFLVTRECMDPTLPLEMYSSQQCFRRLQRHDINTRSR
jgi:hypothetical protein